MYASTHRFASKVWPTAVKPLVLFFLACLTVMAAHSALAANQRAEVGKFNTSGKIALQLTRFQEQLADGTKLTEIAVAQYEGNLVVQRKGYLASGECRMELANLTTATGQILAAGTVLAAGTRVYLWEAHPVNLLRCVDRGCKALNDIKLPNGDPTVIDAHCDRTDLSGDQCRCHVRPYNGDGSQEVVNADHLCYSLLDRIFTPLSTWVRLPFVQSL